MAVVATGAHMKLLMQMGVLKRMPDVFVASRAYFEGVHGLDDCWTLRFDGVPLPGYGWVFPMSKDCANIGVGYFSKKRTSSAANAFQVFVQSPPMRKMLADAQQVGPVKGFPLRSDFTTAPTFGERVLLVGEAAGLVNPLTGEGIDYALESGRLAAQHLAEMFECGDFAHAQHQAYDALLRSHFQALFEFCERVRDLSLNRTVLNILVSLANRRDDLRSRLASVVLGREPVKGRITARRVVRVLVKRS
jgi:flavin-dependent dehydrogenase